MLLLKHVGLPIPNSVFLWVAGCFCAANPRNLRWKKVAMAKASAVSKNVLETMFCAYRAHRIRKNIFVISKNHRNSWENSYTKSPTAQSDKLFLQNQCLNAIHPIDYRTCVQLYMGLLRWDTRKAHAEWISRAWANLHPLPGNSSASALASASLERLSAWNDDRRKWSNDEWIISINIRYIYVCVCAFRIIQIYSII
jgi:hypothetical protein